MSIIRLIHIKIDPSDIERALLVWKTECAPLMIQQKGCISEKLLRCREAHELISYSEWDTEADIEHVADRHRLRQYPRHRGGGCDRHRPHLMRIARWVDAELRVESNLILGVRPVHDLSRHQVLVRDQDFTAVAGDHGDVARAHF